MNSKFIIRLLLVLNLAFIAGCQSVELSSISDSRLEEEDTASEPQEESVREEGLKSPWEYEDRPFGSRPSSPPQFLRAATWNVERFYERKRESIGKPKLQPATGPKARTVDELMTYWVTESGIEILAMQEILDVSPYAGLAQVDIAGNATAMDKDFPVISGFKLLPGPDIKSWHSGAINEKCPIYYRTGDINECSTEDSSTMGLSSTNVHWAKCTTRNNKEFYFGCAHLNYADIGNEVRALTRRIKNRKNATPGATQRPEFILGMDANSYHAGLRENLWADFGSKTGVRFYPVGSTGSPTFTKILRRNGRVGISGNSDNHVLDWLLFQVAKSLEYDPGTMQVIPLARYTKGFENKPTTENAVKRKTKEFLGKYYEDVSDHWPVKADFLIK